MSNATAIKKRPLLIQLWWLLRHRPGHFWIKAWGHLSFWHARVMRAIFGCGAGIDLDPTVRLQNNRSLLAEQPHARIKVGAHTIIYRFARIEAYGHAKIEIGECSIIGDLRIASRYKVSIGKRTLSSWNVFIQDFDPHPLEAGKRRRQVEEMVSDFRPAFGSFTPGAEPPTWSFPGDEILIGDDVWLGANCIILKGARIGAGSVVAAGAVVLRGEYPPGSLLAGNPAKIIRTIDSDPPT
ncbi:MAG: acyltransferase [Deltaproteobacteria bacterium]|nr:acyltransferase [Deltaproteobacteria bacterium]